jgi:hypothetical protein
MNVEIHNSAFGCCHLTTEHSASSYGLPVLMIANGDEQEGPFGPGDRIDAWYPAELLWLFDGCETFADAMCKAMAVPSMDPTPDQVDAINAWMAPIRRTFQG